MHNAWSFVSVYFVFFSQIIVFSFYTNINLITKNYGSLKLSKYIDSYAAKYLCELLNNSC